MSNPSPDVPREEPDFRPTQEDAWMADAEEWGRGRIAPDFALYTRVLVNRVREMRQDLAAERATVARLQEENQRLQRQLDALADAASAAAPPEGAAPEETG